MIKPRKPPYGGTEKDPEQTILDINKMLRDYGVTAYQWTTMWDQGRVELRMVIDEEGGRRTPVRLLAPALLATRRTWNAKAGHYEKVQAPNWSQSMRMFWWYLKAKLEAIAFGLKDVQGEFLSDVMVRDPSGQEWTVGELVHNAIKGGAISVAKALGSGPKEDA